MHISDIFKPENNYLENETTGILRATDFLENIVDEFSQSKRSVLFQEGGRRSTS